MEDSTENRIPPKRKMDKQDRLSNEIPVLTTKSKQTDPLEDQEKDGKTTSTISRGQKKQKTRKEMTLNKSAPGKTSKESRRMECKRRKIAKKKKRSSKFLGTMSETFQRFFFALTHTLQFLRLPSGRTDGWLLHHERVLNRQAALHHHR